ncbi:TniB family NTP-binding protein [Microbulbifer sp. OS29]|uniref:TniB family NTP-binding protein n=1 Tax=Microbulbifer okhotskensis TaxID=2926617 RepID=A0A9X2ERS2_9GAMM|nr:TniB family NTP-binding protein [Microbulbifer okhotskensis]MCO1334538.1 TniB family NTP-binding protein [Microbulbifer okhotskensis]
MNEFNHIHTEFQHVMTLSASERLLFLDEPRWIGYDRAQIIIDSLCALMDKPKRPRMPGLLIVGDSNNGKTTIIRRFYDLCGKSYVSKDGDPIKPIILAEAPPSADEKSLYISLLERFFAPYRASDSTAKLRYQVIHLFRTCHVRMLIIDEFHSLLTGTATKQREVMNAIKLLCNELCIPIVGVGTREAVRVLHSDPQHASRFDVITLPLWELNKDFQKLLASFEKVLPLQKRSRLHQPEFASAFHAISSGNLGDLHRLLIECVRHAIESGTECITPKIIKDKSWVRPTRGIREIGF